MTDLEQKLINELSKVAKQYAEDQERLSGQVERLEKQVQRLDESHIEAESRCRHCLEASLLLRNNHLAMAEHIEQLTTAYETQQSSFRSLADGFMELQRDITELAR